MTQSMLSHQYKNKTDSSFRKCYKWSVTSCLNVLSNLWRLITPAAQLVQKKKK